MRCDQIGWEGSQVERLRYSRSVICAAFTAGLVLLCLLCFRTGAAEDSGASNRPLLLAFYHPWYGTPWGPAGKWIKWDSSQFPGRYHPEQVRQGWRHDIASGDYPLIGPHDVSDPEIVRWHFRLAKAAGIDGFLCSWWKVGQKNEFWDWQYQSFGKLWLNVAEEENFKIAVIDECAHYVRDYDQLLSRITNHLPGYAKSPGYLKIRGQPVWFVYQVWDDWLKPKMAANYVREAEDRVGDVYRIFDKMKATAIAEPPGARLTVLPEWLAIRQIDCFGSYSLFANWRETNATALTQLYMGFAQNVRAAGKAVQLPVLPGHDNTAVNETPYVVARREGETLRAFLQAVEAAKPELAVICSFNEWFEMTEIEPSLTWNDPYLYLKIIAEWRGKQWQAPPLPPNLSLDPLIPERTNHGSQR